ncbi:putative membrane protein [Owenweeksia hongkongensis DSM 17368]|uniref:Putative membrane protein n=1 Tax=Owenweeksia hongkongensis (strain DSM 17368 / CIP 108786 / JCM 12287 / NRRL B-23963 / UST20020801) TaxID=926562 RepID=G8R808_OWEHD|nr:PH domain-containing protein [Owenweeksia hongkongensis]AEV31331.1 putative membrane protein [Owenweeksia hongkongensis DSM 17368]
MNNLNLNEPQRQSLVGVAVIFFKNLRVAANIFISVILVQFGTEISFWGLGLKEVGFIIAGLFLIISYLQYRRFYFYVVDDKFIMEKGLLSRDRITIPFDRIQTVNLNQNIIQQVLGVMAVKVDTAGSTEKELEISALPKSYARELQNFLIEKKEETKQEKGELETETSEDERETNKTLDLSTKRPLVTLPIKDLLLVGLTENHLRTGLLVFAVINGYVWQFEEYLLKPFEPFLEEQANTFMASWLILLPIAVLAFLFISVLMSMIQSLLKYFNLEFFVDAKGVQLVSGLLKRAEYQIPNNKIQYLKWKSNPLRKLIGLRTLAVKQASPEDARGTKGVVRVPGCRDEQLEVVLDTFYPQALTGTYTHYLPNQLLRLQHTIYFGIIPSILITGLGWFGWIFSLGALLYLPISLFFIKKYFFSVSMLVSSEMLILKKGWVFPSRVALPLYKLQNVKLTQSIFQKQRNLASVTFYTAAGVEGFKHLPFEEAVELYDFLLYKIEVEDRGWM